MNRHFAILGLNEDVTLSQLKLAYHSLAKKNHPDLFPDHQRRRQQLKMMRINEAYMSVMSDLLDREAERPDAAGPAGGAGVRSAGGVGAGAAGRGPGETTGQPGRQSSEQGFFDVWKQKADPGPPAGTNEIGSPRDPAYSYYKAGFQYYRLGATELFRKEAPKLRTYLNATGTTDGYILRLALRALHYFERSYSYFLVVVDNYGESPWAFDARYKLRRLEKFSSIYQRICENLSRRSSSKRSSFSIVSGAEPS